MIHRNRSRADRYLVQSPTSTPSPSSPSKPRPPGLPMVDTIARLEAAGLGSQCANLRAGEQRLHFLHTERIAPARELVGQTSGLGTEVSKRCLPGLVGLHQRMVTPDRPPASIPRILSQLESAGMAKHTADLR